MGRKNQIRKSQKEARKKPQKKSPPIDLYFLLISTIIIIPLIFTLKTVDPNIAPRLLGFGIIIFGIALINILKPAANRPQFSFIRLAIFPVFFIYLVWSVISLTQAVNPAEGLFDISKTLLSVALLIFATQIFINYKNSISILVKLVVISSTIATSIGLYQYFNNVPGNTGHELFLALYKIKGLMAHKNQFAISLYLMLPFALYGIYTFKKWWWGISIYSTLLILLNIIILQTRSVWIAMLVFFMSMIVLWLFNLVKNKLQFNSASVKKGSVIALVFIIVVSSSFIVFKKTGTLNLMKHQISSIFNSKSSSNHSRLKIWKSTWELSKDNFIMGVGAGNWKISMLPYYNTNFERNYENWRRPHNDFLWVLSEKGIIGLLLYLMIFLIIIYYSIRIFLKETDKDKLLFTSLMLSGIGGYLVITMVTFPLERINHQIYLMLIMASIISLYFKETSTRKSKKHSSYLLINVVVIAIFGLTVFYAGLLVKSEVYALKIFEAKKNGKWKKMVLYADKAFSPLTTVDSFSSPIILYRGVGNIQLGNLKQALIDFKIAHNHFPTHISALNNLGIVSANLDDSKMAFYYFNKALEIYPNYQTSLFNIINANYLIKDYESAYITLMKCDPKSSSSKYKDYMRVVPKLVNGKN